jgi:rhodanese-related sulfurtransferase
MSAALNPAACVLVLALACTPGADADWVETKAWVRAEFPDVPVTTVDELSERLERSGAAPVLLDARAEGEFAVSHLAGARHTESAEAALAVLDGLGKDEAVVVYCSVGYRSALLTRELAARGYTNVRNLEGSIFEWANRGLPLYRDGLRVAQVHPFDAEWGRLLERELWAED